MLKHLTTIILALCFVACFAQAHVHDAEMIAQKQFLQDLCDGVHQAEMAGILREEIVDYVINQIEPSLAFFRFRDLDKNQKRCVGYLIVGTATGVLLTIAYEKGAPIVKNYFWPEQLPVQQPIQQQLNQLPGQQQIQQPNQQFLQQQFHQPVQQQTQYVVQQHNQQQPFQQETPVIAPVPDQIILGASDDTPAPERIVDIDLEAPVIMPVLDQIILDASDAPVPELVVAVEDAPDQASVLVPDQIHLTSEDETPSIIPAVVELPRRSARLAGRGPECRPLHDSPNSRWFDRRSSLSGWNMAPRRPR